MADKPSRGAARRIAVAALFRAFPGRTTGLAVSTALEGALPAMFAALVGVLIGTLPDVVHHGFGSTAGHKAITTLVEIGAVLLAQEFLASAHQVLTADLYRRYDHYLLSRVMAAALRRQDLELQENPELAAYVDRARRAAQYGPGELVSGLSGQWTAKAQGFAAAVLVGYYWPVAAVVLAALWLVVGRALRSSYYRANPFWRDPLRRAHYLRRIGVMPAWAKEIRIFGLVDWLVEKFSHEWTQVMAELWRARRADYRVMSLLAGAVLAAHLIVAALLAHSATSGALSVAAITVIMQGLFGMASIASQQGDVWIENGAVPVPDVLALERVAHSDEKPGRSAAGLPRESIAFQGVDFGYPGRDLVLSGLDLRIQAGTSLAIVGINGAGKTTLVKLLTGLSRPGRGTITVDGVDLATIDPAGWRGQVAAIFQDFIRYEFPLRDNIAFGAMESGVDDAALQEVIDRAGARALTDALPAGLDTVLSPRFTDGVDLSGGQWQRVAFARALAAVHAGARVLVMDEPTAHLDVRAEADLYDRFLDLTRGLTTVVISHRFSTVRRADRIVVLDGGRIVEDGSHDELVARNGRYGRMFALQASNYTDIGEVAE